VSAEVASDGAGYEVVEGEPPEVLAGNLASAGYLLSGATAFFFLAFLFAFFYLRSIDKPINWKPPGVHASIGWGTAIVACWVASAVLVRLGALDQRSDRRSQWRLKGLAALLLGLAGLVVQVVAWTQSGFGPMDGAYASVFVGWTGFMFVWVLGTLLWLEMTLATSWRYRSEPFGAARVPAGHASGDSHRTGHDIENPVALNTAELAALGFFWTFVAGVAVVAWVVLYLVA
jgi:heme/copper-type cytochrome/quinol oxidase subunit 3